MSTTVSVSEARAALHDLLELVRLGEEVTLTRDGRPVAVLVRPDRLRARSSCATVESAAAVGELLAAARSSARLPDAAISSERAEELVAAVRAGRERR